MITRLGIFHIELKVKNLTTFEYLSRKWEKAKSKKKRNRVDVKKKVSESSKKSIFRLKEEREEENSVQKELSISQKQFSNEEEKKQEDEENGEVYNFEEIEKKNLSLINNKSRRSFKSCGNYLKFSDSELGGEKRAKKKSTRAIMNSPERRKLVSFSEKNKIQRKENDDYIRKSGKFLKQEYSDSIQEEDYEKKKSSSMADIEFPKKIIKNHSNLSRQSKSVSGLSIDQEYDFEEI